MSLAHSFDVKEPQDLLRGLLNALNEYETSKDEGERPKMVRQYLIFEGRASDSSMCSVLFSELAGRNDRQQEWQIIPRHTQTCQIQVI